MSEPTVIAPIAQGVNGHAQPVPPTAPERWLELARSLAAAACSEDPDDNLWAAQRIAALSGRREARHSPPECARAEQILTFLEHALADRQRWA